MNPRLLFLLPLLAGLAASAAEPPGKAANDDPDAEIIAGKKLLPSLQLELFTPRESYELGDPIDIRMLYTYTGDRQLAIEHVTYDRCGRILGFGFRAIDEKGKAVRDPIGACLGGDAGGQRGSGRLSPAESYSQKVFLNEWLCFDQPGRYTVTAHSGIVSFDPHGTGGFHSGPTIPLTSEPLTLEITPPVDAHRLERIERAKAALLTRRGEEATGAMRDLRFMVDERAIPLMIEHLGDRLDNVGINAYFGLVSFRDTRILKAKVLEAVSRRPSIPANELWSYVTLLTHAHLRERGIEPERYSAAYDAVSKRWRAVLTERESKSLKELSPVEAANATVAGLAFGPTMDRNDIQNWKRILDHIQSLSPDRLGSAASIIEHNCRLKELIPRLKEITADPAVNANVRAAAMVALHDMGDESWRDTLFADITSPKQALYNANWLLGDYRAKEAADKLLDLIEPGGADPNSAARRLAENPYAAAAAPVERLRRAYLNSRDSSARDWLLETLAQRSPEDACDLIRDARGKMGWKAPGLLAAMDFPAAQSLILETLRQGPEEDRQSLPRRLAAAYFPELLQLYRADPSGKVRAEAMRALAEASGIGDTAIGPKDSIWSATPKKEAEFLQKWEAWWAENSARFGRWSPASRGVALKCSTDRGVYELNESIRVQVRLRRESGDAELAPELRLKGEAFGPEGIALPLPREGEKPVLAAAPRSEAAYRLDLQRTGAFGRPGTYSFTLAAVLKDKPGEGPESPPVRLHVRPAPDGLKWTEPSEGLALSVACEKRAVGTREGCSLEVRLKNASAKAALTLPWPVFEPEFEPSPKRLDYDRDRRLRFMRLAVSDDQGKALDLGPEPKPEERPVFRGRPRPEAPEKKEPSLVELLPGQVVRFQATPAWRGPGLRHLAAVDDPGIPEAASNGGTFRIAVTYEVPKEAPLPPGVWRGSLTADAGPITLKALERPSRRREEIDEKALGLDEIKLPPQEARGPGKLPKDER